MLKFSKIVGTGNDFIFVDLITATLGSMTNLSRTQLAQRICDRHFGVGADGIIFVENAKATDKLKWDFYNRDGSQAEFCGNAARCFGRWTSHYLRRGDFIFESRIGDVKVATKKQKTEDRFIVHLENLTAAPKRIDIKAKEFSQFQDTFSKLEDVLFVVVGVPHFVCVSKSKLSRDEMLQAVGAFRFHSAAGLAGANVTFLYGGETQTFERGVEDFTLSCGTGVLSAAICVWRSTRALDIPLQTPGGDLRVEIVHALGDMVAKANLIGPAEYICEGTFVAPAPSELEKK